MATKIILKKSSVAGNAPSTAQLDQSELAINLVDRKIYTKDNSNQVVRLDGAYVGGTAPSGAAEGDLWYDTANNALKAHDGTTWQSAGYQNLSELEDVTITSIAAGEILKWDGSEFVNNTLAEADIQAASDTEADSRAAISVTDAGGDGSLAYDSGTGVITYTGPSASEVQAHFSAGTNTTYSTGTFDITDTTIRSKVSAVDAGGDGSFSYDPATGIFSYTGPNATEVRAHFSAGTGVTYDSGSGTISIGQAVETTSDVTFNDVTMTGELKGPATFTIDPAAHGDDTGTVVIAGNLRVDGTTTTVNSNEVNIGDSIIVLNSDETGAPSQNGGFEIERGTSTNVSFIWDEVNDYWSLGNEELADVTIDGGSY